MPSNLHPIHLNQNVNKITNEKIKMKNSSSNTRTKKVTWRDAVVNGKSRNKWTAKQYVFYFLNPNSKSKLQVLIHIILVQSITSVIMMIL